MSKDAILTHLEDNILTITINRPEKRNAIDMNTMHDLADIFKQVNLDDETRCVIVTGAGDYFCAGADISDGAKVFDSPEIEDLLNGPYDKDAINRISPGSQVALSIYNCYKPVIAAINGPAAGIGATMILPMDYRLMSDTAKLGYVFTKRGIVPEAGSSWFLPRVVGMSKASDWLLSGRLIEPQEALDAGLVRGIYKPEDLLPAAKQIAQDLIATTSAVSVACTRQLLWKMSGPADLDDATALETTCFIDMATSPEAMEGMQSFLEKRPPQFPGKVTKNMPRLFKWWGKS